MNRRAFHDDRAIGEGGVQRANEPAGAGVGGAGVMHVFHHDPGSVVVDAIVGGRRGRRQPDLPQPCRGRLQDRRTDARVPAS